MNIQAIFYANPDYYPPIINSAYVLAHAGYELSCSAGRMKPAVA